VTILRALRSGAGSLALRHPLPESHLLLCSFYYLRVALKLPKRRQKLLFSSRPRFSVTPRRQL